ncbi:hypothetical protein BpHYR1_013892 [Brachionus plicatilis]|uniref:Uncharacterized protein n=1 Tax=Brachionus plicatilis TaxID=10195 RepID=A0A3M7QWQ8_BRAPC|nr:hypothetical protein BpHYR1_013892 [Brachionus plicatilis]
MPKRNFPRRSNIDKLFASGSIIIISLLGKTAIEQPGLTCLRTRRPSLFLSTGAFGFESSSMED